MEKNMSDNVYVKIRFDDKSRKHPYVVRISESPSDNYRGWDEGIHEGHLELVYGQCRNGCVIGADAIEMPECSGEYTYHPVETINDTYRDNVSPNKNVPKFPNGIAIYRISDGKRLWGWNDEVAEAKRAALYKEALINSRMNDE